MLELKSPPARHGKRALASWFGVSLLVHAALLVGMLAFASAFVMRGAVQPGGAVMVRLAGLGATTAGATLPADAAASSREDLSSLPDSTTKVASEHQKTDVDTAVAIKRKEARPKPAEKHSTPKAALPAAERSQQSAVPQSAPVAQSLATATNGDGGMVAANSGAGSAEQPVASLSGNGSQQPHAALWNTAGGPGFVRQGALRYPRAALRRNLEGRVVVEAYLDMQGKLVRARVLQADHEDFADAALACIQASSFRPARREGKAIPCVVRIPIMFVLRGM